MKLTLKGGGEATDNYGASVASPFWRNRYSKVKDHLQAVVSVLQNLQNLLRTSASLAVLLQRFPLQSYPDNRDEQGHKRDIQVAVPYSIRASNMTQSGSLLLPRVYQSSVLLHCFQDCSIVDKLSQEDLEDSLTLLLSY